MPTYQQLLASCQHADREGGCATGKTLISSFTCLHGPENIMTSRGYSIVLARVAALLALGSMVAS